MIYQMAKIGAQDGRPMRMLYFSDADPSGWNMGVAIAHKLRAFKILHFPGLDFQVHRAALTPEQVRGYIDRGEPLPDSPLKEAEKRGDAWKAAFGLEQTEIDSLATLRPQELRSLARQAIAPFYDFDLANRVEDAREEWLRRANEIIIARLDADELVRIRAEAAERLTQMREQIDELNSQLRVDVSVDELPYIDVPESELTQGLAPTPLLDSSWPFTEQCQALIDSKAYRNGGGS
jgi:hypothetical protein